MYKLIVIIAHFNILSVIMRNEMIALAVHAKIGNYPGVTLSNCGIGYKSSALIIPSSNEMCFKWHTIDDREERRKQMANIYKGRNSTTGEHPYLVRLDLKKRQQRGSCSGSVLNKRWILTAAHCFLTKPSAFEAKDVTVIFNYMDERSKRMRKEQYKVQLIINHEYSYYHENLTTEHIAKKYVQMKGYSRNDITLLKLTEDIRFKESDTAYIINAICLPQKYIMNTEPEWAISAGWGLTGGPATKVVKTGLVKILPFGTDRADYTGQDIYDERQKDGDSFCEGDSGGPLFQYVNNRAVQIGINTETYFKADKHPCPPDRGLYLRVSKYIDWITESIHKHP